MTARLSHLLATAAVLALTAAGCANVKKMMTSPEDVAVKQAKRTAEALQAFETSRDFAQFQAAQARWREGNPVACREALDGLLSRSPAHFEGRVLLAELLLSETKYEEARKELELAIAQKPEHARSQHMMGLVLEAMDQESEALAFYQRAAELDPRSEQFAESCRNCAKDFDETPTEGEPASQTDKATGVVQTSHQEVDEADDPSSHKRALADAERAFAEGDLPAARLLLSKAVARDPNDPDLVVRAAVLALRQEQSDTAVSLLQPAAARFTDSSAILRTLGTAYYRQGDYPAAQRTLQQSLSLDNSNALAYLLMGCTLEKLGQSAAAKSQFEQARRLDPRL